MMQLCKELLGVRNNVDDESLTPQEWVEKATVYDDRLVVEFKSGLEIEVKL
jgi:hypothetical protein